MKLKILIILGVLLLVGVSCRDEHDGPLQKEAYGLAVYSPDEKTLTIQDELDTTEVRKTYPTDYASFGFGDEKVDLTQKVYVYFYGNSLEMVVSHLDIDRAPNYQLLAYRLGLRHFWHSPLPYLMPVAVVLLCLGYYCRYRYVLRRLDVKKGLNLVRQAHLLFLALFIAGWFNQSWLGKSDNPAPAALADVQADETVCCLDNNGEIAFLPAAFVPENLTVYRQNGEAFAVAITLTDSERIYFRSTYDEAQTILFRLYWLGMLLLLSSGLLFVAMLMRPRIARVVVVLELIERYPNVTEWLCSVSKEMEEHPEKRLSLLLEMDRRQFTEMVLHSYEELKKNPEALREVEEKFAANGVSLSQFMTEAENYLKSAFETVKPEENGTEDGNSAGENSETTGGSADNAKGNLVGEKSKATGGSADKKGGA